VKERERRSQSEFGFGVLGLNFNGREGRKLDFNSTKPTMEILFWTFP
jgi:hypothetical protein